MQIEKLTKGELMKLVFGDTKNIDTAIPKEHWGDDSFFKVTDFRKSIFGEVKDMREIKPELFK